MFDTLPVPVPCSDDPDLQFDAERIAEAKAKCNGCWFKAECRARGEELSNGYGVWGGVAGRNTAIEASELLAPRVVELKASGRANHEIVRDTGLTEKQVRTILGRVA